MEEGVFLRLLIAVAVCRLLYFFGSKLGRGSSLPGLAALKIYPGVLSRLKLPEITISVTGSNGKTSTAEMIVRVLTGAGMSVGWNHEGSNQIEGLATLLLRISSLGGKARRDVLVFESDERSAHKIFEVIKPHVIVITNLCRDQLTRNGHYEFIQDRLREALDVSGNGALVLNADDPFVAALARRGGNGADEGETGGASPRETVWFGIANGAVNEVAASGMYDDGAFCPVCKARMAYDHRISSHMGGFQCGVCGYCRRTPDYEVTGLDYETGEVTLSGNLKTRLALPGLTGAYNLIAAIAAAAAAGINAEDSAQALEGYKLTGGRTVRFTADGRKGILLVSKHENSLSYNQSLSFVARQAGICTVVILVDAISRRYYTSETSWLWDVDFSILENSGVRNIVLAGQYVNELAARFLMTNIEQELIGYVPDLSELRKYVTDKTKGDIYAITCFADKAKLKKAFAE